MFLSLVVPKRIAALGLLALLQLACANGGGEDSTGAAPANFCGALGTWTGKCTAAKTPCDDALAKDCPALTELLNSSVMASARTCVAAATCDRAPLACLAEALPGLTPSDAQKSLATKFCAECAKEPGAACETAFFAANAQTILPFADHVAEAVGAKCMTKIGCVGAFPGCASAVVSQKLADRLPVETVKCLAEEVIDRPPPTGDSGVDGSADTSSPEDTSITDTGSVEDTGRPDTSTCGTDREPDTFASVPVDKNVTDCDGSGSSVSGTLETPDDVDYFRFHGEDTVLCRQGAVASTTSSVRLCMLPKCDDGTYPAITCTKGLKSTVDGRAMCCGTSLDVDFNCSGTNDSADVYLRVSGTSVCKSYVVSYHY